MKPIRLTCSLVALGAALSLGAACSRSESPSPGAAAASSAADKSKAGVVTISDAARSEAKEIFANRCTTCHGQTGAGDGPASAGLTPQPRNLQSPEWQQSVTDEHIEKIISYGGAAVGRSPMMPPNPDLNSKPELVAALREFVRNLAEK